MNNGEPVNSDGTDLEPVIKDLREQLEDRDKTIEELKKELEEAGRPGTAQSYDWEDDKIRFELEIMGKDERIGALENEQMRAAEEFAGEIADLSAKMTIAGIY